MHLKGVGGCKRTIQHISKQLQPSQFVLRTDVKAYYNSMGHHQLFQILTSLVPDKAFCRLVWQSLQHTVYFEGNYQTVRQGLSRSNPMSPLLGAIMLLPLDQAMGKHSVFYRRYMDDWVIIAKTRWGLKRAIKTMHKVLSQLRLHLHPDKTSIGRATISPQLFATECKSV